MSIRCFLLGHHWTLFAGNVRLERVILSSPQTDDALLSKILSAHWRCHVCGKFADKDINRAVLWLNSRTGIVRQMGFALGVVAYEVIRIALSPESPTDPLRLTLIAVGLAVVGFLAFQYKDRYAR